MPTTTNPGTEADRVRQYTDPEVLEQIEDQISHNVRYYAAQTDEVIHARIEQLRREWSIERYLQVNVCSVGLLTTLLAVTSSRKWALLTCTALSFFLYHGLRGFDPPIPLLRRMGIRTRGEIDRELFALKAVRGDFQRLPAEPQSEGQEELVRSVLRAVNA